MYNIAGTFREDQGLPNTSPWARDVTGRYFGWLGVQAAGEASLSYACVYPPATVSGLLRAMETLRQHARDMLSLIVCLESPACS